MILAHKTYKWLALIGFEANECFSMVRRHLNTLNFAKKQTRKHVNDRNDQRIVMPANVRCKIPILT